MRFIDYTLLTIFLIGLVAILAASEIGLASAGRSVDNISTLESGVLGLLALIVAFTFAMALSRFDARRDAVLNEANAIGTTALRARLLPEPTAKRPPTFPSRCINSSSRVPVTAFEPHPSK